MGAPRDDDRRDRDDRRDGGDRADDRVDPRLGEPQGHRGIPGEVVDTPANLPGDQPDDGDEQRPDKTDLERDPS